MKIMETMNFIYWFYIYEFHLLIMKCTYQNHRENHRELWKTRKTPFNGIVKTRKPHGFHGKYHEPCDSLRTGLFAIKVIAMTLAKVRGFVVSLSIYDMDDLKEGDFDRWY